MNLTGVKLAPEHKKLKRYIEEHGDKQKGELNTNTFDKSYQDCSLCLMGL